MTIILKNKDTLVVYDHHFKCSIGKNGITSKKREGDFKTPKGIYYIDALYYRADRIKKPNTNLRTIVIKKNMGWSNDIKDSKNYNKLIKVNNNISHEKMYRHDNKYNLVIPIKYNFKQPILGKGSAIFLHLTFNYKPTAGCIALSQSDFLILLKLINKRTRIKIY